MPEIRPRTQMNTIPGLSVRKEIDSRLETARVESRTATIEEVITFLGGHGYHDAADALQRAAFGSQDDIQKEGA